MTALPVQAENFAPSPECARLELAFSRKIHSGGLFTWQTEGAAAQLPAAIPRMAIWGDSLTSAPDFIDAALNVLDIAPDTVLPSYIQAGMTVTGLRLPLKTACASKGWQVAYAHKEKRAQAAFSKGLLSLSSENPGDTIFLDFRFPLASTRVTQMTLVYEKPAPDDSLLLGVSVDDGDEKLISLSKSAGSTLQIRPDTPMATIRLRLVSGKITVHGFAPSYEKAPALILDTFSVPGGTLRGWSATGERWFSATSEGAVDYSTILVQYGTNEGASPAFSYDSYVSYLRANLGRLRQFYPRSRCILIGPPDRGVVGGAGPGALKYANVHHHIALAQKQVGLEQHCEFWDWQAAMGGPGSAVRWSKMNPPQMQQDLTHLSARGYQVSGRMFAQSLLLNKK